MLSGRCFAGFSLGLLLISGCEEGGSEPVSDAAVAQDAATGADAAMGVDAAAPADTGVPADAEAGAPGGDGCVPFVMPQDCTIPENSALPSDLRCTGLYGRFEQRELACNVLGYAPAYALWSDNADKHRYVWLPADGKLDASDPNDLTFPVGAKFWKEFRAPNGGRLLETRLLQKVDAGWVYTAYVWSEDQQTATQNNDGVENLLGTGHVVPNRDQCDECHRGRKDKILGWDALMLGAGAQGLTRDTLVQRGLFAPGKELPSLSIPGDEVERAALGYLHANCGVSCHNTNPRAKGGTSGLNLRLDAATLSSVVQTPAVTTSINKVPSTNEKHTGVVLPAGSEARGYFYGIRPGDPTHSFILARMKVRGADGAMPQLATNVVDQAGVAAVTAWIERMASPAYPAPAPVPYDPDLAP
jgi:hypothetical protein